MGRNLKQSLEVPVLTRELYVSQGKICVSVPGVSARVSKSFAKCLLSEVSVISYISSYISPKSFIQTANALCLTKKMFIKVSIVRLSRLVIF